LGCLGVQGDRIEFSLYARSLPVRLKLGPGIARWRSIFLHTVDDLLQSLDFRCSLETEPLEVAGQAVHQAAFVSIALR
jgi:hypothetical protein